MGELSLPQDVDMSRRPPDWNTPEKADRFRRRLFDLHRAADISLRRLPIIGHRELDVYQLFMYVEDYGGFRVVANDKLFRQIGALLELPRTVTNSGYVLRGKYEQLLKPFEETLRREFYPDSPYYIRNPEQRGAPQQSPVAVPDMMHQSFGIHLDAPPEEAYQMPLQVPFGQQFYPPSQFSTDTITMPTFPQSNNQLMYAQEIQQFPLAIAHAPTQPLPPSPQVIQQTMPPPPFSSEVQVNDMVSEAARAFLSATIALAGPSAADNTGASEQGVVALRDFNTGVQSSSIPWHVVGVQAVGTIIVAATIASGEQHIISGPYANQTGLPGCSSSDEDSEWLARDSMTPRASMFSPTSHIGATGAQEQEPSLTGTDNPEVGMTAAGRYVHWTPSPFVVQLLRTVPQLALPIVLAGWPYPHVPLCSLTALSDQTLGNIQLPRSISALSIVTPPMGVSGLSWPAAPTLEALSLVKWPSQSLQSSALFAIAQAYPSLASLELSGLAPGALSEFCVSVVSNARARAQGDSNAPALLSHLRQLVIHDLPAADAACVGPLAACCGRLGDSPQSGLRRLHLIGPGIEYSHGGTALFGQASIDFIRNANQNGTQHIGQNDWTPERIASLAHVVLENVGIVDINGLSALAPRLRHLTIIRTRVTGGQEGLGCAGTNGLMQQFTQLQSLRMKNCPMKVAPGMPDGEALDIIYDSKQIKQRVTAPVPPFCDYSLLDQISRKSHAIIPR